jgi:hypothetical protein
MLGRWALQVNALRISNAVWQPGSTHLRGPESKEVTTNHRRTDIGLEPSFPGFGGHPSRSALGKKLAHICARSVWLRGTSLEPIRKPFVLWAINWTVDCYFEGIDLGCGDAGLRTGFESDIVLTGCGFGAARSTTEQLKWRRGSGNARRATADPSDEIGSARSFAALQSEHAYSRRDQPDRQRISRRYLFHHYASFLCRSPTSVGSLP